MPGVGQKNQTAGQQPADDFGNHYAENQNQRDNQAAAADATPFFTAAGVLPLEAQSPLRFSVRAWDEK